MPLKSALSSSIDLEFVQGLLTALTQRRPTIERDKCMAGGSPFRGLHPGI